MTNWYFNSYRELHYLLKLQKLKRKRKRKMNKTKLFPGTGQSRVWVMLWSLLRITYTTPPPSPKSQVKNKDRKTKVKLIKTFSKQNDKNSFPHYNMLLLRLDITQYFMPFTFNNGLSKKTISGLLVQVSEIFDIKLYFTTQSICRSKTNIFLGK